MSQAYWFPLIIEVKGRKRDEARVRQAVSCILEYGGAREAIMEALAGAGFDVTSVRVREFAEDDRNLGLPEMKDKPC